MKPGSGTFLANSPLRPLFLEAFFLVGFLVCRHAIDGEGHMPAWLAWAFLVAIATETVAVAVKLRAVRHRLGDASISPLPGNLILLVFFSVIRIAVFAATIVGASMALTGSPPGEATFNLLLGAVVVKEVIVLVILARGERSADVPGKVPEGLEFAADVNLVFVSLFSALLVADLASGPTLDTSWNPLALIFLSIVFLVFFNLFVIPFRVFAAFRPAIGSSVLTSIVVSIFFLAPLYYNSAHEEAQMAQALAARPDPSEFVYDQTSRLNPSALERICKLPSLRRLALHTRHTGYLPPCITEIPGLTDLDLAGNDLTTFTIRQTSGLRHLDLSHNQISNLGAVITHFPELETLDVSHNPLTTLPPELVTLRHLKVLRLQGTHLAPDVVRALRQSMPWTRFEW